MSAARSDREPLRFGARVRIGEGPHAGELGEISSVLREEGETDYQVQLTGSEQGRARRTIVGFLHAEQLEVVAASE